MGGLLSGQGLSIELEGVAAGYGQGDVFSGLTARFEGGRLCAVCGPNGSGKSTLAKCLIGEIKPSAGAVRFAGCAPADVAYMPQAARVDRALPLRALEFVAMGLWREVGVFKGVSAELRRAAEKALRTMGLGGLEKRRIGELSGGQFQRLLFARMLAQRCPCMVLDEPFAAVDRETTNRMLDVLAALRAEGKSAIVVTHDLAAARDRYDDALLMAQGRAPLFGPAPETMTDENLRLLWLGAGQDRKGRG